MSKRLMIFLMIVLFMAGFTSSIVDAKNTKDNPSGGVNKKYFVGHVYLFEKDPVTWERVPEGAWGKMQYKLWYDKFYFVFNGHGLIPHETYMLIYYPDPWPGSGLIPLGIGIANDGGNINIKGRPAEICDLPANYDENYGYGAKVWLVLASDVDSGGGGETAKMSGWNPYEYLFEYNLITFDNTDCEYDDLPDQVEEATDSSGS